ncbi:hypothetical protein ACJEEJ_13365 [Enterococcus faecalis]|uniref:hypothetical protein n=1 Tax=Enterococcus faecalis TaxID=1351 RepID=UPI003984E1E7
MIRSNQVECKYFRYKNEERHEGDSLTLQDKMIDGTEVETRLTGAQADKAKEIASKRISKEIKTLTRVK